MNEVLDDIHDDNDVEEEERPMATNATSISGLGNNSRDHRPLQPPQPQFEASYHKASAVITTEQDEFSENAVALDALNPAVDKDYDDQGDIYDEHSEEDEAIVPASEDKNSGEVVAVTEANSLNEAVVELATTPTTLVPGKVGSLDQA